MRQCTCTDCAKDNAIEKVVGAYTPMYEIYKVTAQCEALDLIKGDVCEQEHNHATSKSCRLQYMCDTCEEMWTTERSAGACCSGWSCLYCGEIYMSAGLWSTPRQQAASCCVMGCDYCSGTGWPDWHEGHECEGGESDDEEFPSSRSARPPWEQRGIKVDGRQPDHGDEWRVTWDIRPEDHNVVRAAADYYLLEAILSGLVGTTNGKGNVNGEIANHPSVRIIRNEGKTMMDELVAKWDPILIRYTHMAVGGELRHHGSVGGSVLSGGRNSAWSGWKIIFDAVGTDALTDAAVLFREFGGNSFGGDPWAKACEILHARLTGKISKQLFLDRIFNAQHNGGCLLNKVTWGGDFLRSRPLKPEDMMSMYEMTDTVLPAHGTQPEPDYSTLLAYASKEVRYLFSDSWKMAGAARKDLGLISTAVSSKPPVGDTKTMRDRKKEEKIQAEQQAYAKLKNSEKKAIQIEKYKEKVVYYQRQADQEAKENARNEAKKGTLNWEPSCGYGSCTDCDAPSHYYAFLLESFTKDLALYQKQYKELCEHEAQAVQPAPAPEKHQLSCLCVECVYGMAGVYGMKGGVEIW